MGRRAITSDAAQLIAEAKSAGKSSRETARIVHDRLGIELDQSAISRHWAQVQKKPKAKQPSNPKAARARRPATTSGAPAEVSRVEPTLNEIEALQRRARRLQELLEDEGSLSGARDVVALNAELRQTFASLRRAQAAKQVADKSLSREATEILERLRKMANQQREYPTESKDDGVPLPAAVGSDLRGRTPQTPAR